MEEYAKHEAKEYEVTPEATNQMMTCLQKLKSSTNTEASKDEHSSKPIISNTRTKYFTRS